MNKKKGTSNGYCQERATRSPTWRFRVVEMVVQFIKLGTASFVVKWLIRKLRTVVYRTHLVMFRKNGKADGFVELYFIAKKRTLVWVLLIFLLQCAT